MYFSLPSSTFADITAAARLVICPRTSLPVLTGVHFHVDPSLPRLLTVGMTDLDIFLRKFHSLDEPAVPGTLLLPFDKLAAIRPDKNTHVVIHRRSVAAVAITAICGGAPAVHHLNLLDADSYPGPPTVDDQCFSSTELPPETLAAIAFARPFQSSDVTRYVLNATLLHPGGVVATDGRRLAMFLVPGPPIPVILPTKTCDILIKLKAKNVTLFLPLDDPAVATFRIGSDAILHSKLIGGNYPNFRQVIPPASSRRLTFADPVPVIRFLRRLTTADRRHAVTITPLPNSRLELSHAEATLITPAVCTEDMGQVSCNPSYLADCLESVGATFSQEPGPHYPPLHFSAPNALAVLMPFRIAADEPVAEEPVAAADAA